MRRSSSERSWLRHPLPIARHRVLVLGTGAMGGEIVDWLVRVGLQARGWNRRSPERLAALLGQSEVVVCALPLTEATEGILDARAPSRRCRAAAMCVNVARGAHVVEPDLIAAVRSGHLAGAALDVQRREPMPDDDPLWSVPGITITPHIAAQSSPEVICRPVRGGAARPAARRAGAERDRPVARLLARRRNPRQPRR